MTDRSFPEVFHNLELIGLCSTEFYLKIKPNTEPDTEIELFVCINRADVAAAWYSVTDSRFDVESELVQNIDLSSCRSVE